MIVAPSPGAVAILIIQIHQEKLKLWSLYTVENFREMKSVFCFSVKMIAFCFGVFMISFYLKILSIREEIILKGCCRSVEQNHRDLKQNLIYQYQPNISIHLCCPKVRAAALVLRSVYGYLLFSWPNTCSTESLKKAPFKKRNYFVTFKKQYNIFCV